MASSMAFVLLKLTSLFCISFSVAASNSSPQHFLKCFQRTTGLSTSNSNVIFTKNSSSYTSILQFSAQNLRFLTSSTPKPQVIVTPKHKSHIQAAVICSRENGFNLRTRSGGHDYEGLSYVSHAPFVTLDLHNLRSIRVDVKNHNAWVESGATVGELYHQIAEKSKILGFPAGTCPTVGVGGHFSGGGFGTIFRKFGLAADNIVDALIVDVNGRILDRRSMGEDLFWAIRGGGGASFGVIFAWKVKLVPVPSTVTIFEVTRTLEQGATKLLQKWQTVADKLQEELFLHVVIGVRDATENSNKTVVVSFGALFLGGVDKLLTLMEEGFPELGVERDNCTEMSWIGSVLYYAGYSSDESYDILLNRTQTGKSFYKAKSDYVKEPISQTGWEGLWKIVLEDEAAVMILTPYGGKMSKIPESEIPFPHRRGNMFGIQYTTTWEEEEETGKHMNWIRRLYSYMTPYVSKSPRAAYLNYRDLDLGINSNNGNTSYAQASVWGLKYFKTNFKRLVRVKTRVDPSNFFRNEQSIPIFMPRGKGN